MSIVQIPDDYSGPNFNKKILYLLKGAGIDPLFVPAALKKPITNSLWTIDIPTISAEKWRQPNFRLVVHAQDFVHYYKNELCSELFWLEQQYTEEQQHKIIFLHWDHQLADTYSGRINCVEFASHSYELVHQLKERWHEWKDVLNKSVKYNWICLNGHPKPHRDKLYQLLQNQPSGVVTHGLHNPAKFSPYFSNYGWNNVDNFISLMPLYQQSKASIVSETVYADHPGIISEKTLLAIAAKHPFMCIGHRKIHCDIQQRGFNNFEELFDLSYDDLPMDIRLTTAIDNNLSRIQHPDWQIETVQHKVEQNFDYLLSDYTKQIEKRCFEQLLTIMNQNYSSTTVQHYQQDLPS